jgi:hypothetical protein
MLARARLWAVLSFGVLALLGVSALIGWVGAEKPRQFDWGLAASAGTAIGTLALAAGTFSLALITRRSVELARQELAATEKSIEVAVRNVETTIRPLLADVPAGQFFEEQDPRAMGRVVDLGEILVSPNQGRAGSSCRVPMRNVGRGVAILGDVAARLGENTNWENGRPSARIVPPDEMVTLSFELATIPENTFYVEARYQDLAGGQPTRTQLKVNRVDMSSWRAVGAAIFEGEERTPFVVSGEWA